MNTWTTEQRAQVEGTIELYVAPFREDGVTTGTPTRIWFVFVDDRMYARAGTGAGSSWYRAALAQQGGQVTIDDVVYDVTFAETTDPSELDDVDEAYRVKYAGSQWLAPMIAPEVRAATVQIGPKS